MELTQNEADSLASALRQYARMVSPVGDLDQDLAEHRADLAYDPTYAYDPAAIEAELERTVEEYDERLAGWADRGAHFDDLAEVVASRRQLDLSDEATRPLVEEVIEYAGWVVDGEEGDQPPADLRKVVAAVQSPRETEITSQPPSSPLGTPAASPEARAAQLAAASFPVRPQDMAHGAAPNLGDSKATGASRGQDNRSTDLGR